METDHTYFVGRPEWGFSVWAHNAYRVKENPSGGWDVYDDVNGHIVNTQPFASAQDATTKATEWNNALYKLDSYSRRKQYGNTPTRSDRQHFGAGVDDVVDHDSPLSVRYYHGHPEIGIPPGYLMSQLERLQSAADQARMGLQARVDSNLQGAKLSAWSKMIKKTLGLE